MNSYDSINVSGLTGSIQIPQVTTAISTLEQDVRDLKVQLAEVATDTLSLRAQVAHEMAVAQILREYIEYLNPADGKRPRNPMSYAEWLKMQAVNEQILAARAAA
jgi:hypothetical protein